MAEEAQVAVAPPKTAALPPNQKTVWFEKNPGTMFKIDWDRFTDPDFIELVNAQIAEPKKTIRLGEMDVSVPEKFVTGKGTFLPSDEDKLREALSPAKNEAGVLREKQTVEKAQKIIAERERIRKLTDDIIPISPIENPNLVRRFIRTVRRTWKRIKMSKKSFITWWRL
jgi:hypothetical protein